MTARTPSASTSFRMTLWTKLVVFTTLIVLATCSTQGWFFLQEQAALVTGGLINNGTFLAQHLAVSNRYSILVNDSVRIRERIAGVLTIEHVAYVIVRSADGQLLIADGKEGWGKLFADKRGADLLSSLAVPPPVSDAPDNPTVRSVLIENGALRFVESSSSLLDRLLGLALTSSRLQPWYFDIAVPVLSPSAAYDDDPALSLTLREAPAPIAQEKVPSSARYGTVHVGLSDAHTLNLLRTSIRQALLLTGLTIAIGLVGVLYLARRISAPIRSLTATASRLEGGDFSVRATPASSDEIGDLARTFNDMVHSLQNHERDLQELNRTLEARVEERTEELHRTNRRLEESNHLKTALVANASHELRTPLTAMTVHLSNMLNGISGPLTPSQEETLRRVCENTDRLRRMIDDLLDLSRLQGHRLAFKPVPIRLDEIIQDVLFTFHQYRTQKHLSVHADFPGSLDCVWGDADKLRQVFANLIHNAMKFAPAGGTIRLTAEQSGSAVVTVSVADSGCGIPAGEFDKIFLPFYRFPTGTETPGSGLGLTIVKELVELHGGAVRLESTVGQGSRFFVDLPLAAQSHPEAPADALQ